MLPSSCSMELLKRRADAWKLQASSFTPRDELTSFAAWEHSLPVTSRLNSSRGTSR